MNWIRLILAAVVLLVARPSKAETVFVPSPIVPPPPIREFRGAWIATVANIDWPSKPGLPVAQQKAELISLLDRAAQLHLNAVLFQVRPVADAFYASPLEPWSEYLTGTQGKAPSPFYDPLTLAIVEAHKRGLQLHAWFNPFRAGHPESKSPPALNHITRTHPEIIRHYGKQTWSDPGEPEAQARALAAVLDVVKRYDVDGVVLDDYFYPYPEKNWSGGQIDFPDDASWKKRSVAETIAIPRDVWRRENINRFVQKVSQSIHSAKPWVQFGISPFGIWRPSVPAGIDPKALDAYGKLYADAPLWLRNGWVDYLAPQLYWPIADREHSFPTLLDWWHAQNSPGRHVWPALADYKFPAGEITRQVQAVRTKSDAGSVHYHLRSLLENAALAAAVRTQYAQPALAPSSPWLGSALPPTPKLTVTVGKKSTAIRWENSKSETPRWWILQIRTRQNWTTEILPATQTARIYEGPSPDAIANRAADRLGNLSEPEIWPSRKPAAPAAGPGAQK